MLLDIEGERTDAMDGFVRSHLTAAIGSGATRVEQVKIVLSKLPLAFSGLEHACRVTIRLRRRGAVRLAEVGANLHDIIKRVGERIEDLVGSADDGTEDLEVNPV